MTKPLDFIIIGAQKAGTTTLFHYLAKHPRIFLPLEKEVPFFSDDAAYARGWDHYCEDTGFSSASPKLLWGKATPHYMCDPAVPARIQQMNPEARLIAILRDPLARAVSHYRMTVRRKLETRSFDDAVTELMRDDAAAFARTMRFGRAQETKGYLAWGEYGRILSGYLSVFPAEQLLVVFAENLGGDPGAVLDAILEHVGLAKGFRPANLGARYHVGGSKQRVRHPKDLPLPEWVRALWHKVPRRYRRRLLTAFDEWNFIPEKAFSMDEATRRNLISFFASDVAQLRNLTGLTPPWMRPYELALSGSSSQRLRGSARQ